MMKKIFTLIFAAVLISACGTTSKFSNDPFTGEGYGTSTISNENGIVIAKERAFNEACAEITRKYGVEVSENAHRTYNSNDNGKGKAKDLLSYGSVVSTKSDAVITDVVVVKEKIRRKNGGWTCHTVVKVDAANVE